MPPFDAVRSAIDESAAAIPGIVAAVSVDGHTVFEHAAGVRAIGEPQPMTLDTVFAIYSMTKLVTAAAAMQLVERGALTLDGPVADVLPDLGRLKVLAGFTSDGSAQLRDATTPITLRHLLTHTSGLVHQTWNGDLDRYVTTTGMPTYTSVKRAALHIPLMFDPGTAWHYGIGVDWAGLVIEAAAGVPLSQFCADHLFGPLGMTDTGYTPTASMEQRMAGLHLLTPDGAVPFAAPIAPDPEFERGGGGLLSTVPDYLRFQHMILNGGVLDGQRVLTAETVATMSSNCIGDLQVRPLVSVNPVLSADVDFFPGARSTWGLGSLINMDRSPQGRPPGSLSWAGLTNTYYWIDPVNRICGIWATQMLPFFAPPVITAFRAFETAVYA